MGGIPAGPCPNLLLTPPRHLAVALAGEETAQDNLSPEVLSRKAQIQPL